MKENAINLEITKDMVIGKNSVNVNEDQAHHHLQVQAVRAQVQKTKNVKENGNTRKVLGANVRIKT